MSKKMQVLVVFEFDGVDDIESDKADEIIVCARAIRIFCMHELQKVLDQ